MFNCDILPFHLNQLIPNYIQLVLLKNQHHHKLIKWLVSKETLCCVGGQVKQLVDYQLEVDKGKLTAAANQIRYGG